MSDSLRMRFGAWGFILIGAPSLAIGLTSQHRARSRVAWLKRRWSDLTAVHYVNDFNFSLGVTSCRSTALDRTAT